MFGLHKTRMITADQALPGRSTAMPVPARHEVLDAPLVKLSPLVAVPLPASWSC
jgi:peptide-methionine (S)-S-oxide reductase